MPRLRIAAPGTSAAIGIRDQSRAWNEQHRPVDSARSEFEATLNPALTQTVPPSGRGPGDERTCYHPHPYRPRI
jgi:hypothetical protein